MLTGVGFSKHLLQLWSFKVSVGFKAMIEIEAHTGSVNDIVFYTRNENLRIVTCGEDGFVKVCRLLYIIYNSIFLLGGIMIIVLFMFSADMGCKKPSKTVYYS